MSDTQKYEVWICGQSGDEYTSTAKWIALGQPVAGNGMVAFDDVQGNRVVVLSGYVHWKAKSGQA